MHLVQSLYSAWRAGTVSIELTRARHPGLTNTNNLQWHTAPVTLGLILLSICGFLILSLPALMNWARFLTFTPLRLSDDQLLLHSLDGQYWRLVTPVFLHFGWLHIVFNSLWLWDLGGKVERVLGHFNMVMLFLVIAVVSNFSQFAFGGAVMFGGMSGVVYGFLGFSWVAPMLQPAWQIQPSSAIMMFMVGWLVLCLVGVVEVLGFGAIANAAHIGGLICGALLGGVFGALSRMGGDKGSAAKL